MGRCNLCRRRRQTWAAERFGGGSYRSPGRWYSSQVCLECVNEALEYVEQVRAEGGNPGTKVWMYSIRSLESAREMATRDSKET